MIVSYIRLLLSKFRNMPFDQFLIKAYRKIYKNLSSRLLHLRLLKKDLRGFSSCDYSLELGSFDFSEIECNDDTSEDLKRLCQRWMTGVHDILGSGPISINKDKGEAEFNELMFVHFESSKRIVSLISSNYQFKKWNVDFKSGECWSLKEPSFSCKYGDKEGVDIKVPWELTRFQHLPQMALYSNKVGGVEGEGIAQEIIDQVMDFWAFNPVYMGPNWICAMDVGIRAANILIALDMIQSRYSNLLTPEQDKEFANFIYHHGKFIVENLEYSAELTSNHYVGDIVGLLFISFYLRNDKDNEADCWLAFSIQEIISEIQKQYCTDGGNFERSTSYHRLSSEMLLWAVSLIQGLSTKDIDRVMNSVPKSFNSYPKLKCITDQVYTVNEKGISLPLDVLDKMFKAVNFSIDLMKHDGLTCQFGDNDSGRFIKLTPIGEWVDFNLAVRKYLNFSANSYIESDLYWDESCLNHSAYVSAGSSLFCFKLPDKVVNCTVEKDIISIISRGKNFPNKYFQVKPLPTGTPLIKKLFDVNGLVKTKIIKITCEDGVDLTRALLRKEYLDTGIIVYQSDAMYLAISNMPNGALGSGAHSHNDQMSIELQIKGEDICKDPGAYLYTSSPKRRNELRGVAAHNVMRPFLTETNRFFGSANALFAKENESKTAIFEITDTGCRMQIDFYGIKQQRVITIHKNSIIITDKSNYDFDNELNKFKYFSKGFGFLEVAEHRNKSINIEYING